MATATPWLVLHRASRSRGRLRAGLASRADYLELDVWLEDGRVALRHDPLLIPGFPYLTRRRVYPVPRLRRFWLDEVRAPGRVFLDLKEARPELVGRCIGALRATESLAHAMASTPIWPLLDALASAAPEVGRYYSIGRGEAGDRGWWAYVERMGSMRAGDGVSIHRETATPDRLALLHEGGLRAICYTVNDYEEGVRLVEAGAGGLTTDRLELVTRWRERWPPPGGSVSPG